MCDSGSEVGVGKLKSVKDTRISFSLHTPYMYRTSYICFRARQIAFSRSLDALSEIFPVYSYQTNFSTLAADVWSVCALRARERLWMVVRGCCGEINSARSVTPRALQCPRRGSASTTIGGSTMRQASRSIRRSSTARADVSVLPSPSSCSVIALVLDPPESIDARYLNASSR